jgi:hypothetical protein
MRHNGFKFVNVGAPTSRISALSGDHAFNFASLMCVGTLFGDAIELAEQYTPTGTRQLEDVIESAGRFIEEARHDAAPRACYCLYQRISSRQNSSGFLHCVRRQRAERDSVVTRKLCVLITAGPSEVLLHRRPLNAPLTAE